MCVRARAVCAIAISRSKLWTTTRGDCDATCGMCELRTKCDDLGSEIQLQLELFRNFAKAKRRNKKH